MNRLKFSVRINPALPPINPGEMRDEVSFLPMENLGDDGSLNLSEVRPIKQVRKGYTPVANGDVVLAKITPCFENGKGALCAGFKNGVAYGTTELIVLRPSANEISGEYLYWLTHSQKFRSDGESEMKGAAGQKRVPEMFVANYRVPISSYAEQAHIATYLAEETGKIDRLVELRRRQIKLLKEQRASLIQQAVTRGLDPNIKLKDSGIPWIGKIPDHWEVRKISRSFRTLGSGTTPASSKAAYHEGGTISWVNTGDLNDGIVLEAEKKITELALNDHSVLKLYPPNTLLIALYGATIGKAGLLGLEACTNQACCALGNSRFFRQEFIFYWFLANKPQLVALAYGGGQPNISQQVIRSLLVQCPPLTEQDEIVRNIAQKSEQFGDLIGKLNAGLDLLSDYRAAIINECVTGQRRIPA